MAVYTLTFRVACTMSSVFLSSRKCIAKGILGDVVQLSQVDRSQSHSLPHNEEWLAGGVHTKSSEISEACASLLSFSQ